MIDPSRHSLVTGHPLFGLALTIGVYLAAARLYAAAGRTPMLHPVLISVAVVCVVLWGLGIDYERYFASTAPLYLGLSVFVVLLSVPLVRRWSLIQVSGPGLVVALAFGRAR